MKIRKAKLEWYAMYEIRCDNTYKLKYFNVLREDLKYEIAKKIKKRIIKNKQDLKDAINSYLMYHYWSKCEYEVAISGIFDQSWKNAEKIDVYSQLKPNLDRIVEHIYNEMQLDLK